MTQETEKALESTDKVRALKLWDEAVKSGYDAGRREEAAEWRAVLCRLFNYEAAQWVESEILRCRGDRRNHDRSHSDQVAG